MQESIALISMANSPVDEMPRLRLIKYRPFKHASLVLIFSVTNQGEILPAGRHQPVDFFAINGFLT